jgi:hypothetical protein
MKRTISIIPFILLVVPFLVSGFGPVRSILSKNSPAPLGPQLHLNPGFGQRPLAFEPNQGQTDSQVKFLARGSGYTLFVADQEAVLVLKKYQVSPYLSPMKPFGSQGSPSAIADTTPPTVLRLKLEESRADATFETLEQLPGISNYFIGKDLAKWHTHIPQYGKVAVRGLYPGVDMVYYGNQGKLEYDFVVQPGGDTGAIHMTVEGAQGIQVNGQGDMELQTSQGQLIFKAPTVYQETGGLRKPLTGRYRLGDGNEVSFEVGDYDHTKPLVIDPVLLYSTFLGGLCRLPDYVDLSVKSGYWGGGRCKKVGIIRALPERLEEHQPADSAPVSCELDWFWRGPFL